MELLEVKPAFKCLLSIVPIEYDYIRKEGIHKRISNKLIAIVAEGHKGRIYLAPNKQHEEILLNNKTVGSPKLKCQKNTDFQGPGYGINKIGELFTQRQLLALTTLADLIGETVKKIKNDKKNNLQKEEITLSKKQYEEKEYEEKEYEKAISIFLTCALGRQANRLSTICIWNRAGEK